MLAATGATPKHLRLVLLTNGAVVGAIGAVIGTVVGLALWFGVLPTLETGFDHRIDPLSLPWTLLVLVVLVAMLGATAAAWWPGRAVARVPVTLALSARPPRPKPAHRSAMLAALLIAGGVVQPRVLRPNQQAPDRRPGFWRRYSAPCSSVLWQSASSPGPPVTSPSPHAWRYEISPATRPAPGLRSPRSPSPSASRRRSSSSRQQKRSRRTSGWPPSPRTSPTARSGSTPVERETLSSSRCRSSRPPSSHASAARVRQLAAGLGQAVVIPLWKPIHPGEPPLATFEGDRALVAAGLARKTGPKSFNLASGLYVATPPLLRHLGIDPATVDPTADFLADPTVPTEELVILRFRARKERRRHERPEDRQPGGPRGRGRELRPAVLVRHPRRSSPPRLAAGRERLARRVEQASDERTDRRRARPRGERRPDDRGTAREHAHSRRPSPSQPAQARSWRSRSSP